MKTKSILIIMLLISISNLKAQQDTIIYNQSTGNYTIQYIDQEGSLVVQTYIPWNKINPIVHCLVKLSENNDEYVYNWRIKNGEDSEQNLNSFILRFGDPNVTNQSTCGWHNKRLYEKDGITLNNLWSWWGDQGLEPTWEVAGFALGGVGLPSIGDSYFEGTGGSVLSFSGSPPPKNIMEKFAKIDGFPGGYVLRKTVVPGKILNQLNPSSLIDTLLNYNTKSFELGWITDEQTKTKYENYFSEAKDALVNSDTSSARTYLENVLTDVDIDSSSTLLSEAYALLRYNTEYLIEQLPAEGLTIESISPTITITKTKDFTLTVYGSDFTKKSDVYWNGKKKKTKFISENVLEAEIKNKDIKKEGTYTVHVSEKKVGRTEELEFRIYKELPEKLIPVLNCIEKLEKNKYRAWFGYENYNDGIVLLDDKKENEIKGGDKKSDKPPVIFLPGIHEKVFSVEYDKKDKLKWELGKEKAEVTEDSPLCQ